MSISDAIFTFLFCVIFFFFFNDTATTEIYTLSLHDALPIRDDGHAARPIAFQIEFFVSGAGQLAGAADRKSTRLNSSHVAISYAVFCLKKKKKTYDLNFLLQKKKA